MSYREIQFIALDIYESQHIQYHSLPSCVTIATKLYALGYRQPEPIAEKPLQKFIMTFDTGEGTPIQTYECEAIDSNVAFDMCEDAHPNLSYLHTFDWVK